MSYCVLYSADETDFSHLGLGVLSDTADEPLVTEERNGQFYLKLKYPTDGELFNELKSERIIKADAAADLPNQRFEITRITKPSKGIVTVEAKHYSHRTEKMQLKPEVEFDGVAQLALYAWRDNMVDEHDFTVFSDIEHTTSGKWSIDRVSNARRALGGVSGSMLDMYGGEYRFDNNHIQLLQARGTDNGVMIAYGKNLTDLQQEEEIENTYTSVYPYSVRQNDDGSEDLITLPEYFVDSPHAENFAKRRIMLLNLSDEEIFEEAAMRTRTENYIEANNIGVPNVNLKVSFLDLSKTVDYKHLKFVEKISLCDWVTIYFEKLGVHTRAKVIKTVWNVSQERYETIEVGAARASLSSNIKSEVDQTIERVIRTLNTVQLAADGTTRVFRGDEEPLNGKENDIWFKPVGNGEVEMHIHDGVQWNFEELSAGSLAGTLNFGNLNVINFIADNITGGRLNLANDLQIMNGDQVVLHVDPQSGQVVGNFSRLQLNFKDVATGEDVDAAVQDKATQQDVQNAVSDKATQQDVQNAVQDKVTADDITEAIKDLPTSESVNALLTDYETALKQYADAKAEAERAEAEAYADGKISDETQERIQATQKALQDAIDYVDETTTGLMSDTEVQALLNDYEQVFQTYADTVAELEREKAEVYADGRVSDEERERLEQAQANLDEAKTHAQTILDLLEIGSKNLLRRIDIEQGWLRGSDGTIVKNRSEYDQTSGFIDVREYNHLTISLHGHIDETFTDEYAGKVVAYDENQNYIERVGDLIRWRSPNQRTIEIPNTASYVRVQLFWLDGYPELYKIEAGTKKTDWTPSPEDIIDSLNQKADGEMVNELTVGVGDLFEQMEEKVQISEFQQFIEDYEERMNIESQEIQQAQSDLSAITSRTAGIEVELGNMSQSLNFLTTTITQAEEGVLVHSDSENTGILVGSNRISFFDGGTEVAYVANRQLRIEHGIFTKTMQVGNVKMENLPNSEVLAFQNVGQG